MAVGVWIWRVGLSEVYYGVGELGFSRVDVSMNLR